MAESLKKGISTKFLLPIIAAYIAAAALLKIDGLDPIKAVLEHAAAAGILGFAMLVFQELLPRSVKEVLIFWRLKDRVPGCRAFSKHVRSDQRIDMTELQVLLPGRAMTGAEENALWYRWLKEVENDPAISDNHRRFLVLRDSACLIALLSAISPFLLFLAGHSYQDVSFLMGGTILAYLLTMIAARNSAVRLVCNVISRKIATT